MKAGTRWKIASSMHYEFIRTRATCSCPTSQSKSFSLWIYTTFFFSADWYICGNKPCDRLSNRCDRLVCVFWSALIVYILLQLHGWRVSLVIWCSCVKSLVCECINMSVCMSSQSENWLSYKYYVWLIHCWFVHMFAQGQLDPNNSPDQGRTKCILLEYHGNHCIRRDQ